MKKIISLSLVFGAMPFLASATTTIGGILGDISDILVYVMPILIALAVIYFVWGVITYIVTKEEEQKKKARSKIINGLIGLFVIIAFWGIIGIVTETFHVDTGAKNVVPCTPIPGTPNSCPTH